MSTAVIRINIDPAGTLTSQQYAVGRASLTANGLDFIAGSFDDAAHGAREIELLVDASNRLSDAEYAEICASAFEGQVEVGVTTFVSRGTDEDVHGVLARFGATGHVARQPQPGWDIVTVTLAEGDQRRVPESRLHTALEAALNCEVEIRFA